MGVHQNVKRPPSVKNAQQLVNAMQEMPNAQMKFIKKKPETFGYAAAKEFARQYAEGLYEHVMIDDITHCDFNKRKKTFEERTVNIYDLFNLNRLHDVANDKWSLRLLVDPIYKDLLMLKPDLKEKCIEILNKVKENFDKEEESND